MGSTGVDRLGTLLNQSFGSVHYSAACIDHIVNQYSGLALNITDDVHDLGYVRLRAPLVYDSQPAVEAISKLPGADHASDIGGDYNNIFEFLLQQIFGNNGHAPQVVNWNIKESLNLPGMQIQCNHPVCPCCGQDIGQELG